MTPKNISQEESLKARLLGNVSKMPQNKEAGSQDLWRRLCNDPWGELHLGLSAPPEPTACQSREDWCITHRVGHVPGYRGWSNRKYPLLLPPHSFTSDLFWIQKRHPRMIKLTSRTDPERASSRKKQIQALMLGPGSSQ